MTTHLFRLVTIFSAAALWVASSPRAGMAQALDPRFGLETNFGKGAGWGTGYSSFDWFQPVTATQTDISFVHWSANADWDALLSNNLGFGYRMYNAKADRMFGFYGYYDVRDSDTAVYHQASAGFETVGPNWIMRSNIYIPIKPPERLISSTGFSAPFFQQNFVSQSRSVVFQSALPGADLEFGVPLPVRFGATLYGGVYGYVPTVGEMAPGWRTRLEGRLTDNVIANVAIQDDRLFGLTANVGLAWYWRGWRPRLGFGGKDVCCGTGYQRLATPTWRQKQIAVQDRASVETRNLTQIDCITQEIEDVFVIHVDNSAVGSQNIGTFEDPLTSIGQVSALSDIGDIIFVHGNPNDTTGMNRGVTLLSGQRLLAGGFQHFVTTIELGNILLPGYDPSLRGQTITNITATSDIVTLAGDNIEVSGFTILNSRASGIANDPQGGQISGDFDPADNCFGISINRNTIVDVNVPNNTGAGIFLTDAFGDIRIGVQDPRAVGNADPELGNPNAWGNLIEGHPNGGIIINRITGSSVTPGVGNTTDVNIANNLIRNNGFGPLFPSDDDDPVLASNNGITIIAMNAEDAADDPFTSIVNVVINNNMVVANGFLEVPDLDDPFVENNDGIHLLVSDNGRIFADIINNNRVDNGSQANNPFNPLFDGTPTFLTGISGNGNNGVFMGIQAPNVTDVPGVIDARIANNVINGNGTAFATTVRGDGIRGEITDEAPGQILLTRGGGVVGNDISGNARNGIFMHAIGQDNAAQTPQININATGNTIDANGTIFGVVGVAPDGSGIALLGEAASTITLLATGNDSISFNTVHGVFGQVVDDNSTLSMTINTTGAIDGNGTFNGVVAVGDGIRAEAADASQLAVSVNDNTSISDNFNNGVFVQALDAVVTVVTIDGNTVNNNGNAGPGTDVLGGNRGNNNGVFMHAGDDVRATLQITGNNSINGNGFITNVGDRLGDGVSIHSTDDALYTLLDVTGNDSISNNVRNGVNIGLDTGNATGQVVNVSGNLVIDGNGGLNGVGAPIGAGVQVITVSSTVLAQLNINNNDSISDNGQRGVFVSATSDNASAQRISISDNGIIDDNGRNGLANGVLDPSGVPVGGIIVQAGGSIVLANLSINGNDSVSNNAEYGIDVEINSNQAATQNVFINDNEVVDFNGSLNGQGTPVGDGIRVFTTGNTVLGQLQINDTNGDSTSVSNNSRHGVFVDLNSASGGVANGQNVSISGHAAIDDNGGLNAAGLPVGDGIRVQTSTATILTSLNINNNESIQGNAEHGIFASLNSTSAARQNVFIGDNTAISNNGTVTPNLSVGDGVHLEVGANSNVHLEITDNADISDNVANGIFLQTTGTSIVTGQISGTIGAGGSTQQILNNGTFSPVLGRSVGHGIFIAARGTSTINMDGFTGAIVEPDDLISGNIINGSTLNGIRAIKETGANLRIGIVDNVVIGTNVATLPNGENNGIFVESQGGAAGSFRGIIAQNNRLDPLGSGFTGVSNNAGDGIRVVLNSNGNADPVNNPDLVIDDNVANDNTEHGIHVLVGGNNNGVVITNNTANTNTLNGLQVDNTGAGNQFIIANNTTTFSFNGLNGIVINNGTTANPAGGTDAIYTISNNIATNNGTVAARAALGLPPLLATSGDGNGLLINNRSANATYTITDNVLTDNFLWGLRINNIAGATDADFTVQNNTLTDNGVVGPPAAGGGLNINNNAVNATFDVDGNTVQDNTGFGVLVTSTVNATSLSVNNMTDVSGNGLDGIAVRVTGGTIGTLQINNNQGIDNNGANAALASTDGNGISLTVNGGVVQNWEISGNGTDSPLTGNARDGIRVNLLTGNNNNGVGIGGGVINGNEIGDNGSATLGGNGITVINNATANVVNITNNTVADVTSGFAGGGGNGILYDASVSATAATARINNNGLGNPVDGNARNGIQVDVDASGVQTLEVSGNIVSNNGTGTGTFSGILVNLNGSGISGPNVSIAGNTAADNDGNGISLNVVGGTNIINVNGGNVLQGNTGDGLAVAISGNTNQVLIDGNTVGGGAPALGNDGHGISVVVSAAAATNTINIGGVTANQISNNGLNGIDLTKSSTGVGNLFQVVGNSITANGQSGAGHGVAFRTTGTGATTFEVNGSNTITGNAGDGVNGVIGTNGNTIRVQSNTISDNEADGVDLSIAAGTSGNAYSVSSNTVTDNGTGGTGNGILLTVGGANNVGTDVNDNTVTGNATGGTAGSGIVFTTLAGGTGLNVTMLRNTVDNNLDHGLLATLAAANSTLTFNDAVSVAGNGTGGLGHGIFVTTTAATNTVTLLGNSITGNNDDGINYLASGATGNRLFISDNPIPPTPPVTGSVIGGNGDDGIELTITGGATVSAQIVANTFIATNTDSQFVATTAAAAGNSLSLQFLKNEIGTPGAGASDDYVFTQGAGSTFQFENPYVATDNATFDQFTGVAGPGFGTNLFGNSGDFLFTGFTGTEDVGVGPLGVPPGFFPDPGAPY